MVARAKDDIDPLAKLAGGLPVRESLHASKWVFAQASPIYLEARRSSIGAARINKRLGVNSAAGADA